MHDVVYYVRVTQKGSDPVLFIQNALVFCDLHLFGGALIK